MTNEFKDNHLGRMVGRTIRAFRELKHLTQAELAERVGVTQAEISHIERGLRLRLDTLDRVAQALELRLSTVISDAETLTPEKVLAETESFVRSMRARLQKANSATGKGKHKAGESTDASGKPRSKATRNAATR